MLGKFLGGAMQNTNGQFLEGDVYVITGYNHETNCVQTKGNTSRNRWIDETAFEVVRNEMHTFQHGHLQGLDLIGDIMDFEDRLHDDHVEATAFDPRVWMGIDLANSPDYSATGRYIGPKWSELHEQVPARRLSADQFPKLKLREQNYAKLETRTAAFIHQSPQKETSRERFNREHAERLSLRRQGKSAFNHLFATGHVDALRAGAKERRFAALGLGKDVFLEFRPQAEAIKMLKAMKEQPTITDDIAEAMLATYRSMHVPEHLLGDRIAHSQDFRKRSHNCRCAMPEVKKGLHSEFTGVFILDDPYAAMLEDGKPTQTATFVRDAIEANDKMNKTITARLERSTRQITRDMLTMSPGIKQAKPIDRNYNCTVECVMHIGDFIRGQRYRAIYTGKGPTIRVEHPHTAVPLPVDRLYFDYKGELVAADDRNAPMSPTFEEDRYGPKDSAPEETTFVHKSATRKTQEVHEENDGTANLRKYRFNPEA